MADRLPGLPVPSPTGPAAPPPSAFGWLLALLVAARALLVAAPIAAAFVITSALLAGVVEGVAWRWGLGAGACLAVPLVARGRVASLAKRFRLGAPGVAWFVAAFDLAVAAGLAFGFADDVGRALRRHGDWFVGERNGAVARGFRLAVATAAGYLEKFDPPPELAAVVLPPDLAEVPAGPWRPGEEPPPPPPKLAAWFHPLAGPRRAMPGSEGRRFGAPRPPPRPVECELGHCGVDLGHTLGEPVFASFEGVLEKIERDEARGGRAGRYVRIGHRDGTVVTRYIHLDTIRADLREGDHIAGGELIGRLGASGVHHSGPHLHYAVSLRQGGRGGDERYLDPEPLLRTWQLPDPSSALREAHAAR